MDENFLHSEFEYVANKLDLSIEDLQFIFDGENKTFHDYKNKHFMIGLGARIMNTLGLERRLFR